jgi:hypothetical protein
MGFPKFPVQKAYKAATTPCPCCYTYSGLVALLGLYLGSMVLFLVAKRHGTPLKPWWSRWSRCPHSVPIWHAFLVVSWLVDVHIYLYIYLFIYTHHWNVYSTVGSIGINGVRTPLDTRNCMTAETQADHTTLCWAHGKILMHVWKWIFTLKTIMQRYLHED